MKKFNFARVLAFVCAMMLVLAGCGGGDSASGGNGGSAAAPTAAQVADAMLAAFTPRGELPAMEESVVDNFYSFDKAVLPDYKIYASTTYTAEEIAVFATPGQDAVDAAKKAINTRVDDLKTSFDGYKPEELAVLEENVQILEGNGVVALLMGDSDNVKKAKEAFDKATK